MTSTIRRVDGSTSTGTLSTTMPPRTGQTIGLWTSQLLEEHAGDLPAIGLNE